MTTKVSIIIPTWNACDLLVQCLDSIYSSTYKNYEIIVVDNNSSDSTLYTLRYNYPSVITVKNDYNMGFSKAINLGLNIATGEIIALLNNDTTVHTEYLDRGVKCLLERPDVSIVCTKIYNINDNSYDIGDIFNVCGQAKSLRVKDTDALKEYGRYVFSSCAGASLYRRSLFNSVGSFNEIYYMYFEDFDLCYYAQLNGHKVWFEPTCIVNHIGRASSSRNPKKLEYLLFKNYIVCYLINTSIYLMYKRFSLLKFTLVMINTALFNIKRGYASTATLVLLDIIFLLPKINKIRKSRIQTIDSTDKEVYIDSWRKDKNIKIFGFKF